MTKTYLVSVALSVSLFVACSDDATTPAAADAAFPDAVVDAVPVLPPVCEAAQAQLRACAPQAPESEFVESREECEGLVLAYGHETVNPSFLANLDRCLRSPISAQRCQEAAQAEGGPRAPDNLEACLFYASIGGLANQQQARDLDACFFGPSDGAASVCIEENLMSTQELVCMQRINECREDESFNHVDEVCLIYKAALPNAYRAEFDACLAGSCAYVNTCVDALLARRLPSLSN